MNFRKTRFLQQHIPHFPYFYWAGFLSLHKMFYILVLFLIRFFIMLHLFWESLLYGGKKNKIEGKGKEEKRRAHLGISFELMNSIKNESLAQCFHHLDLLYSFSPGMRMFVRSSQLVKWYAPPILSKASIIWCILALELATILCGRSVS